MSRYDLDQLRALGLEEFYKKWNMWGEIPGFPHDFVQIPLSPYVHEEFFLAGFDPVTKMEWPCLHVQVIAGQYDLLMPQRWIKENMPESKLIDCTLHRKHTNHLWMVPFGKVAAIITPMGAQRSRGTIANMLSSPEVQTATATARQRLAIRCSQMFVVRLRCVQLKVADRKAIPDRFGLGVQPETTLRLGAFISGASPLYFKTHHPHPADPRSRLKPFLLGNQIKAYNVIDFFQTNLVSVILHLLCNSTGCCVFSTVSHFCFWLCVLSLVRTFPFRTGTLPRRLVSPSLLFSDS